MSDKDIKKIIKAAVEKGLESHDNKAVTDKEMESSGQSLPPDEILKKLKEKIKNQEN